MNKHEKKIVKKIEGQSLGKWFGHFWFLINHSSRWSLVVTSKDSLIFQLGFQLWIPLKLSIWIFLASFVGVHPFNFERRGAIIFLIPLDRLTHDPSDVANWHLFLLFPQWCILLLFEVVQPIIGKLRCDCDDF